MSSSLDGSTSSPYKFLDPYGTEDRELFFGRERETRILLSDIVVARLVVLFARTGTGKTSLINAGVRPLLEDRGYATFFVRVGADPTASARAELRRDERVGELVGDSLADQLSELSGRLEQPVVLFFDQFEEFFLINMRQDPGGAAQFISNVADLYADETSGVHIVFAMREEFFVEMDAFRDEIPEIFHNDSNLRLRGFDEPQARDAIAKPAGARGVEVDRALVDELIADLLSESRVEPAQLQIVCDTLWRRWAENPEPREITLAHYHVLGHGENIAAQILSRRLQEEFERLDDREELDLLERLLPLLRTEQNTKYARDVESLVSLLTVAPPKLDELLRWLEWTGLVTMGPRGEGTFVELSHDYLAERLDDVQTDVAAIWPRRVLRQALAEGTTLKPRALDDVLARTPGLVLAPDEAELVLRSALELGSPQALRTFELAREAGGDARSIVDAAIDDGDTGAALAAVNVLRVQKGDEWLAPLARALRRQDIGARAADALVDVGTPGAVRALGEALGEPASSELAREALERLIGLGPEAEAGRAAKEYLELHPVAAGPEVRPPPQPRPPPGPARATPPDERHYEVVARRLAEGEVIPFLGAGVNAVDRPGGTSWQPGVFPPVGFELARELAARSRYPGDEDGNLPHVSQYIDAILGQGQLYRYLHTILDADYPPTSVHRLLARLPAMLRDRNQPQLVVLTTNYDDLAERALAEAGEPFETVWYEAKRGPTHGFLLHRPPDGKTVAIERPNKYVFGDERPVVLKLCGTVDRDDPENDSYVVTEDDYVDYLSGRDIGERVPLRLLERIRSSHFLFVGFSLGDWNLRAILNRVASTGQLDLKSWAIRPDVVDPTAGELEDVLWRDRGDVEVLHTDLRDYVAELETRLAAQP